MRERLTVPRLIIFALAIPVLAVAIAFRVWHLRNIPGINGDEAYYGVKSLAMLHGQPHGWFTPNGNLYNPLFFGPCVLLHGIFRPSFLIMRSIAVTCGVLLLLVNYRLCRRAFDWGTAIASTLALAVLPENIAQSRFGWDPSESVLIDAFVVYFSLLVVKDSARSIRWAVLGVVALAASVLVHPTNAFTGVFFLFAVAWRWRDGLLRIFRPESASWPKFVVYAAVALGVCTLMGLADKKMSVVGTMPGDTQNISLPQAYADLFSGVTAYHYIPGSYLPSNTPAAVLALWAAVPIAVFAAVLCHAIWLLRRRPPVNEVDRILYAGWAASTTLFLLIAGPAGLSVGNERYALCLIVPGVLVVCRSASIATESQRALRYATAAAGLLACCALLASFHASYFQFMEKTGGNAHLTFHTAEIEPKQAAWNLIRSQTVGSGQYLIVATEFWNFEPLKYLTETDGRAVALLTYKFRAPSFPANFEGAVQAGRVWSVEFHDSDASKSTLAYLEANRVRYTRQEIADYAGRPLLDIIRWQPPGR